MRFTVTSSTLIQISKCHQSSEPLAAEKASGEMELRMMGGPCVPWRTCGSDPHGVSRWAGAMSSLGQGQIPSRFYGWLPTNAGFSPTSNSGGKNPGSKSFISKGRVSPGKFQPGFKWKCLLSASFIVSLQLKTTK